MRMTKTVTKDKLAHSATVVERIKQDHLIFTSGERGGGGGEGINFTLRLSRIFFEQNCSPILV